MNFNPNLPPHFTETKTLKAMHMLGISENELMYPTSAQLNMYSKDPELRDLAKRECQKTVDQLIEQVKEKRKELIEAERKQVQERKQAKETRSSEAPKEEAYIEMEKSRIGKMEMRQKRDVENMIIDVLIKQEEQKDEH